MCIRDSPAGFVTRYVAFLLDVLVVALASFLFVTMARVTLDFFGINALVESAAGARHWRRTGGGAARSRCV